MMLQTLIKPRSVFCIVEHLYRNPAIAEAVSTGRFTHAGRTLYLGCEPDWLAANLPSDAEWRIEWSKFYYGLDLAAAFRLTGDCKFLRVWERLVLSWIDQVPVDFDSSDVAGRRIQNWIYAWDLFAQSPRFSGFADGFEERILSSLSEQIGRVRQHLTAQRNHRTLELYALFIAALALPELDAQGALLDFAVTELHSNLLADVRADGVHCESSTHYHMLVLRSFLGVRENARRFGLFLPSGFDSHLERACEFAMHCHRPDGLIPALSDGDTGSYAPLLELAARLFSRPDFLYVASGGRRGSSPLQRNVSFPYGGYYIQRSDWGEGGNAYADARFLIFDCGPLGDGGHGHYDLLSVEIAGGGRPLIVDPGRYTYSEHGLRNWRRWFKGTAAHNTVCVDGRDQTPYRAGKPKGPAAEGRLIERTSAPGLDVLRGEALSPAYEARHTRTIFFIAGEYWLIVDHLRGSRPHRFDLRFHLAPEAWNQTFVESNEMNATVRAPGLALVFERTLLLPRVEPGWVAPEYGVKTLAPVVSVAREGVAEALFYTLVVPLKSEATAPTFTAHAEQTGVAQTIRAHIEGVGSGGACVDQLMWSTAAQPFELGMFEGRASAAWLRASAAGKSLEFAACNVHDLKARARGAIEPLTGVCAARRVWWDERRGMSSDVGGER
ncbi:MAG TPA: alginate lyase family protein [Pyrinomonadaceae bacterium]|nr:alginate lyase family protein [Pyrinomonadaceae bacterium]